MGGGETSFPRKRAEWYMDRQTPWGIHVTNYIKTDTTAVV